MKRLVPLLSAVLAAWCALVTSPATAGGFTVSPVRVELTAQRNVGALTIVNDAATPVTVDARAANWTQREGVDEHADTREMIVTPPVFTLAPGATQIVRVGLRRAPDPAREVAYRIFFTENPPEPEPGTTGVSMNLRLSVPVFVKPTAPAKPLLEWTATRTDDGKLKVRADNRGNVHVQVANLALTLGEKTVAKQPSPAYLLVGQSREWVVPLEAAAPAALGGLTVSGYSDAGELKSPVDVR